MENECLQRSNISRFQSVLCEGYTYTPYAFTTPFRATTTHSESSVIIPLYSYFKNQQKTAKMIDRYSGI